MVSPLKETAYVKEEVGQVLLARWLNTLSARQRDMGQRESALESIEEAVAIERELVEDNRHAFLPDLARSLSVLGDRLAEFGRIEEAREAAAAALRLLAALFLRYPEAFGGLAQTIARDYVLRSDELKLEPERVVVEPYRSLWKHYEGDQKGQEEEGDGRCGTVGDGDGANPESGATRGKS
jgi:tetratricopeptide (TPR) repeat protein